MAIREEEATVGEARVVEEDAVGEEEELRIEGFKPCAIIIHFGLVLFNMAIIMEFPVSDSYPVPGLSPSMTHPLNSNHLAWETADILRLSSWTGTSNH